MHKYINIIIIIEGVQPVYVTVSDKARHMGSACYLHNVHFRASSQNNMSKLSFCHIHAK